MKQFLTTIFRQIFEVCKQSLKSELNKHLIVQTINQIYKKNIYGKAIQD